jgi:siroheme synthase (precorrin-2 oxidase/ferrochelatase)
VSVTTSVASPSLAQWVRARVRELLPPGLGSVASVLREERAALHAAGVSTERDWSARVEALAGALDATPGSFADPST